MIVSIGSENPVKVAGVKQAFAAVFPDKTIEYITQKTDSGVREQPLSIAETIDGAINRAHNAVQPDCDFSIGLEGGLEYMQVKDKEIGIEIGWCCVLDPKTGTYEVASSSGFPILPKALNQIRAGKDLSQAMELEYGISNAGMKHGYVGWLSNNVIDRQRLCFESVVLALNALIKEERPDNET